LGSGDTHLLVDTGISKKRVEIGLSSLSLSGADITGILITHEHSDHIQGLGVFCRKYKVPIYATEGTIKGIERSSSIGKLPDGLLNPIAADEVFQLGSVSVNPFAVPHDANEPVGYRLEADGKAVAVATDLGGYDEYIISKLTNLDALLIEANHDIHMLEVGPYPYPLKQRILSKSGHLSNELTGRLLCDILHKGLKNVVLGHLSKDNNYAKLAYETVKLELSLGCGASAKKQVNLQVANRDTVSTPILV
jgi:phosphoribosyl 1,2-cyclic phosphodiesterase